MIERNLQKPLSKFEYFNNGLLAAFILIVVFGVIFALFAVVITSIYPGYLLPSLDNYSAVDYVITGFLILPFILFCLCVCVIAAKGWKEHPNILSVIGMALLFYVPVIGQIYFMYFLGKGNYIMVKKQKYVDRVIEKYN